MRLNIVTAAAFALMALAAPAQAQFVAPFGGPGLLTSPEVVSGAIGASAAQSAAQQQQPQCTTIYAGRSGPQSVCGPEPTPAPRPKR